jgi:hypothetical protein
LSRGEARRYDSANIRRNDTNDASIQRVAAVAFSGGSRRRAWRSRGRTHGAADGGRSGGPQTHWEQYKNSASLRRPISTSPIPRSSAIDLHAHEDPDSYPRQWDAFDVAKLARDRGCAASS